MTSGWVGSAWGGVQIPPSLPAVMCCHIPPPPVVILMAALWGRQGHCLIATEQMGKLRPAQMTQ